ncbi:hypothetical protein B0H16DRAFT_1470341 [Mycena metata]|uniref:Uncharacterized protein n=1 Tax=Mycena metata TaxID=1033252 RepID=A0AAD7HUX8_9AGAR|nr:hypothetical protein B0H16DRAFT_1470341 [Mycena metata]
MEFDGVDDDGMIIDYEDNDVDGMIRAVAAEHPEAARKFFVNTPAIMAKRTKSTSAKRKLDSDDTSAPRAKGKAKKKTNADDSDMDEPPSTITYYVFIPKILPATSSKRGGRKLSDEDRFIQRGPLTIPTTAPYSSLLNAIATALPCPRGNILESQILWKPKKPKNADKLALGYAAGYKVLVDEMEEKAPGSRHILLFMPAPAKPLEEAPSWDTDDAPPPTFDYSQLELAGATDSVQQQKIAFNKATKDHRGELEEKYPIGKHPSFPQFRVYKQPNTGFLFELNNSRMGVWSAGMGAGTADVTTPPASRFFDAGQRIKIVPNTPATPAIAPALVLAPAPAPAPAPTPAPSSSLVDVLLATLLTQNGGGGLAALFPQLNPVTPAAPPPLNAHPHPRTAPPSPVKDHSVTLENFCTLYGIPAAERTRLEDVGFLPGDQTDGALSDDLRGAGFTILGWKRVHNANVRFKADLAAGRFD